MGNEIDAQNLWVHPLSAPGDFAFRKPLPQKRKALDKFIGRPKRYEKRERELPDLSGRKKKVEVDPSETRITTQKKRRQRRRTGGGGEGRGRGEERMGRGLP